MYQKYLNWKSAIVIFIANLGLGYYLYTANIHSAKERENQIAGEYSAINSELTELTDKAEGLKKLEKEISGYQRQAMVNFRKILRHEDVANFFTVLIEKTGQFRLEVLTLNPGKSCEWPLKSGGSSSTGGQSGGFSVSSGGFGGGQASGGQDAPKPTKKEDGIHYFLNPLNLKLQGDLTKIGNFLAWLNQLQSFVAVEKFWLSAGGGKRQIVAEMDIYLLSYKANLEAFEKSGILNRETREQLTGLGPESLKQARVVPASMERVEDVFHPGNRAGEEALREAMEMQNSQNIKLTEGSLEKALSGGDPINTIRWREVFDIKGLIHFSADERESLVTIKGMEYKIGDSFIHTPHPGASDTLIFSEGGRPVHIVGIEKNRVKLRLPNIAEPITVEIP